MVKVYGADWCGDTKRVLKYLDALGLDYQYIDVEQDAEASEWVQESERRQRTKTYYYCRRTGVICAGRK